jgi:amidohydrolase
LALHVDPELAVGRVAFRPGPLTACCSGIDVEIVGRGGHAARPHHTVDPIAVAIQFVNGIYQLVPRTVDSREPVVVSFGVIEGGRNPNVIPERVHLSGTIRTLGRVASARVQEKIQRIGKGVAEASEAQIEIVYRPGPDAVVNDLRVTETCARAAGDVVGVDHVDSIRLPSMGGEDFSAYLARVPGCMFRLGIAAESGPRQYLHSPQFDVDERALPIGAKILARAVVLESQPKE